jgi:cbb3-type cytochrome oxidase maturation protein
LPFFKNIILAFGKQRLKNKTMGVMVILIVCSLGIASAFLVLFVMSTKKGQFDDTHTPSIRILFEDEISKQQEII